MVANENGSDVEIWVVITFPITAPLWASFEGPTPLHPFSPPYTTCFAGGALFGNRSTKLKDGIKLCLDVRLNRRYHLGSRFLRNRRLLEKDAFKLLKNSSSFSKTLESCYVFTSSFVEYEVLYSISYNINFAMKNRVILFYLLHFFRHFRLKLCHLDIYKFFQLINLLYKNFMTLFSNIKKFCNFIFKILEHDFLIDQHVVT